MMPLALAREVVLLAVLVLVHILCGHVKVCAYVAPPASLVQRSFASSFTSSTAMNSLGHDTHKNYRQPSAFMKPVAHGRLHGTYNSRTLLKPTPTVRVDNNLQLQMVGSRYGTLPLRRRFPRTTGFETITLDSTGWTGDATSLIIVGNIAVYALSYFMPLIIVKIAKINDYIKEGQYYRLVTTLFAHNDFAHLVSNMYSLYNVGKFVESVYGLNGFLAIYFGSGALANLLTYWVDLSRVSVGASSGIYGLIGAMGVYYYFQKDRLGWVAQRGTA
jgi:hypothetical protein